MNNITDKLKFRNNSNYTKKTSVHREFVGGTVTFFTMMYILVVNPTILSASGMPGSAVFAATILISASTTLFIGLFADIPVASAPGMGTNSLFAYTICVAFGYDWREALAMFFISGILHIITMFSPLRKKVCKTIPRELQTGISVAIGVFIAVLGFKNSGLFKGNATNHDTMQTFDNNFLLELSTASEIFNRIFSQESTLNYIVVFGVLIIIALMSIERKKNMNYAALPVGLMITLFFSIPIRFLNDKSIEIHIFDFSPIQALPEIMFSFFGEVGIKSLFTSPSKILVSIIMIMAMYLNAVYDVIGTLCGLNSSAPKDLKYEKEKSISKDLQYSGSVSLLPNQLYPVSNEIDNELSKIDYPKQGTISKNNKNILNSDYFMVDGILFSGEEKNVDDKNSRFSRAFKANSLGTSFAALFGSSPATVYCESASGIISGAKTGLSSIFTALYFIACLPLYGIFNIFPSEAIAPALIIAGIIITVNALASGNIEWGNIECGIPILMICLTLPFTSSICESILFGISLFVVIKVVSGRKRELSFTHLSAVFVLVLIKVAEIITKTPL